MNLWRSLVFCLGESVLLPLVLCAQEVSVAPNHVLRLDGENSCVELPAGAFTNLESATIEAWVKWERFQDMSRVFGFTLKDSHGNLINRGTNAHLWSEFFRSGSRL